MKIRPATENEAGMLAQIIRTAYRTVADRFDLTAENCPKHPSNCTQDWVEADFQRGVAYFLLESEGKALGCAALEKAGARTGYLERLAVVPEKRNCGFGKMLVDFIFDRARTLGIQTIGIGIVAHQDELRQWYRNIGFAEGETKTFGHLPFDVLFMKYSFEGE